MATNNLYLVKNDGEDNLAANCVVVSYNDVDDLEFITTDKVAPNDQVHNCLSYNYGGLDFLFGNDPLNTSALKPNEDPEFIEAEITEREFDIDILMDNDFIPKNSSPVLNAGNNSYVSDVPKDIIGNDRIFEFGTVDIGPYELAVRQINFNSNDIRRVFQDKLKLDSQKRIYTSTTEDTIYHDLYYQFIDNPEDRQEFVRESKIIIRVKEITQDIRTFTDKINVEIGSFEAYYDATSMSIVISKGSDLLGGLFSSIFDDGRYLFYFDEVAHSLKIFSNNTFDKGLSGNRNAVKNVKFGGSSIV